MAEPERTVEGPDEKGIKTVTEIFRNAQGHIRKKVITKILVSKEKQPAGRKQRIAERKKWAFFGKASENDDDGTTFNGEPFDLEMKKRETNYYTGEEESQIKKKLEGKGQKSVVKCGFCGEMGHFTLWCPKKKAGAMPINPSAQVGGGGTEMRSATRNASGKYVPMHRRAGGMKDYSRDSEYSLRVTNISEDANEEDLRDLFWRCGETERVYLARDRSTGKSRGFAFVSYKRKEDMELALEKLDGFAYDNLILHVEKAKPRERKEGDKK
eukprot:CAMPEP_0114522502 /NCGR_PEP_ID=MMETSP0109-20121206/20773_1 /TAXON_ID=29199 /ORGANISM="Chlorarachnion reptans, Strain CCCM449" /LENGTH=268 /DNA_ID=CAMNT_0001703717 /DNA_START=114 /DNA_END=920 /DNA_ORIENTATION=-